MISRTDVADQLDRAADVILAKGLARGTWRQFDGSVCAGEALIETCPNSYVVERNPRGLAGACPATVWAFAYWLLDLGKIYLAPRGQDVSAFAEFIIRMNDSTGLDMEQEMRLCAKELREREGRRAA